MNWMISICWKYKFATSAYFFLCKIAYRRGDILYLAIFGDMQSCGDASPNPSVGTKYKEKPSRNNP
jgi:hypothetical protein